jgi:hypothetical protein
LAFNATTSSVITGDSLTEELQEISPNKEFQKKKPLDLLKDDLAIHAFTLDNFLALWDVGDITRAWYLLPFTSYNHAIRNPHVTVSTRYGLLQTGFSVFFECSDTFSECGATHGISEVKLKACPRKTLWTKNVCRRSCNLGIEIYYAIQESLQDPELELALGRIASYPVECHFGTTRITLAGNT